MIDIFSESTISIAEACRLLPRGRNGSRPHFATVYRWILDGVSTPAGKVKLEGARLGSKWITSREALQRFVERLTPQSDAAPAPIRTPTQRRRAADRAAKKLEAIGI